MLQAHNFIPHQHKEKPVKHSHHHNQDKHHEHDENDGQDDHQTPFSDLTHNADFGTVIAKPDFEKQIIEKPDCCEGILLQLYDKLASFISTHRPHPPDANSSLHLIFLSHSLPLRAPPASSCLS